VFSVMEFSGTSSQAGENKIKLFNVAKVIG
jgi:hypothetical protein